MSNQNIYEMVTNQMIEQLEKGTIPWRKPFKSDGALNWNTGKMYRGINQVLLGFGGEWATFQQIKKSGGKIKKGEKGSTIIFWKWIEKEDEDGEMVNIPLLRQYKVFEINTQVEGLESKRKVENEHDPVEKAEEILNNMINKPTFTNKSGQAFYRPSDDVVNVPPMQDFEKVEEYYSVLWHELTHATGHQSRVGREGVMQVNLFGSEDYSKEELIAEMGASFLNAECGLFEETKQNSAAYIQSWLRVLENDKTLIVRASSQAQKAVDYIVGNEF